MSLERKDTVAQDGVSCDKNNKSPACLENYGCNMDAQVVAVLSEMDNISSIREELRTNESFGNEFISDKVWLLGSK